MTSSEIVVGIDLGTTLSAIAYYDNGQPIVIPNAQNERLTPSVVAFENGRILVGRDANRIAQADPYSAVTFIKRQMGNSSFFFLSPDGHSMPPEEISAIILKKLKIDAEQRLNKVINQAVISVPAYFTDNQRRATKQAAEMAGLDVLRLINEPTAASIAYGITSSKKNEKILVYDLGGGTFDVTILKLLGSQFKVLATGGNYKLGGIDFDNRIMLYISKRYKDITGKNVPNDPISQQQLREISESAKKILSSQLVTEVNLVFEENETKIEITRDTITNLIIDLINLTLFQIDDVLSDAKLSVSDIDQLVLVGGSSRIPLVKKLVSDKFGKMPNVTINPDEAVASGAAIVAHSLASVADSEDSNSSETSIDKNESLTQLKSQEIHQALTLENTSTGRVTIEDVTSHSLGIETRNTIKNIQEISNIIPRNSPIPIRQNQVYYTIYENQTTVSFKVYEGESLNPQECVLIGGFNLEKLPPNRPPGVPLSVTMQYTADGIIEVTAIDLPTKKDAKITIYYEHGLTKKQFDDGQSRLKLAELSFKEDWGWKDS